MTGTNDTTIVADIGARYGMHPSWNGYDAPLRYIAFEPDTEEANRLRGIYQNTKTFRYEVLETALDKQSGQREEGDHDRHKSNVVPQGSSSTVPR